MSLSECFSRKLVNISLMLSRRGIDPTEFARREAPAVVRRAIASCQQCSSGEVCHDWLARTGDHIERVPAFCPNAERFEVIAAFTK